jgi:hypothetical protein
MADSIIVVGLEPGDDYTTLASALSTVPTDITGTGGNYIIECRADKEHGWFVFPSCIQDATHRLIIRAFSGDEVNGKGIGATIKSGVEWRGMVSLRNHYDTLEGFRLEATGGNSYGCIVGYNNMTGLGYIKDCYLTGRKGVYAANSAGPKLYFENVIIADCYSRAMDLGNVNANCELIFNHTTIINSANNGGYDNAGWGSGKITVINSLALDNNGTDINGGGTGYELVDYVGTSDSSGSSRVEGGTNTSYTGLISAEHLIAPGDAEPNYNLDPLSTLNVSGENGGRIGAFLGVAEVPSGTEQDIALTGSEQRTQTQPFTITGIGAANPIVSESITQTQFLNIGETTHLNATTSEQKTEHPLKAIATISNAKPIVSEQTSNSATADNETTQIVYAIQAQQQTQSITVDIVSDSEQGVSVIFAEQKTSSQALTTNQANSIQTIVCDQLAQTINADISKDQEAKAATSEQLSEAVTVNVDTSGNIFVSVIRAEQATTMGTVKAGAENIINTVVAEQLSQTSTQQISIEINASAVICEQLTQAELITIIEQNISQQLNIDIDQITIEILTPTYTIEHLH